MIEIRLHGRGGQGAVVASSVLAHAARRRGFHVQVFPEFGVERRGAPVAAFARLSDRPIRVRTRVRNPDHLIVLDAALVRQVRVSDGLRPGGVVVINTDADAPQRIEDLADQFRVAAVDATAIAARHGIGTASAPIVNTTILGTFAAATDLVGLDDVAAGIRAVLGDAAADNADAAAEAYRDWQWVVPFATRSLQDLFSAPGGMA